MKVFELLDDRYLFLQKLQKKHIKTSWRQIFGLAFIIAILGGMPTESFAAPFAPFKTKWQTTSPNETIIIPTKSTLTYNYDIDGDGIFEKTGVTATNGNNTCIYANEGNHTISIQGTFPAIYINGDANIKEKIVDIEQWGAIEWTYMKYAFKGAINLQMSATDTPNLTSVTSINSMFDGATAFNGNASMGSWDVSNVTDMYAMFRSTAFNQDIGNWDVSSVTGYYSFSAMFASAKLFNQDI